MITRNTPVDQIAGIGPRYAVRLEKLGIVTVGDLVEHVPFRYDNFAEIKSIAETKPDEVVTVIGTIWDIKNVYTRFGKVLTRALINDGSSTVEVIWFNQSWLTKTLENGMKVSLSGKVQVNRGHPQLISPKYEIIRNEEAMHLVDTGRIVPIYSVTEGVTPKWLRGKIDLLLSQIQDEYQDWTAPDVRGKYNLIDLTSAMRKIHFPESQEDIDASRRRIGFDELLKLHLTALKRKHEWAIKAHGKPFAINQALLNTFISSLPFDLTHAQTRAIKEITADLKKPIPMNRLLEGDVGSGKTVVAAAAMVVAFANGYQSLLMAPTEILALQHFETLQKLLAPSGLNISLVTSSTRKNYANHESGITNQAVKKAQMRLFDNPNSKFIIHDSNVFIGTHALLHQEDLFTKVGLIVIDEQHKFGVEQRSILRQKGIVPHVLTMTATPIPRTLALTLYGNLDLSILDEMPKGRTPSITRIVPPGKRQKAYDFIREHIMEKHEQAFIVCPFIEESESFTTVKAATVEYERLKKDVFPKLKLGLLHGRMKSKEKETVLTAFANHKLDILVSTPVVEVGIDIPKATIIAIEASERFGLAALHQLRGRVGRRENQTSYCLLFSDVKDPTQIRRLAAMEKLDSGIKLAEVDLKLRGAGDIYGTRQHGIPTMKVASLSDLSLIEETRKAAQEIFSDYYLKGDRGVVAIVNSYDQKLVEPN